MLRQSQLHFWSEYLSHNMIHQNSKQMDQRNSTRRCESYCDSGRLKCKAKSAALLLEFLSHNMIHLNLNKVDSQEFLKQMTSAIDSLHLCISCLQVCKVFIEEVLAQKPCMYGNKFRLNLCIRFITHSGSIGHKNRKRKYKNEALKNFIIRLWQIVS